MKRSRFAIRTFIRLLLVSTVLTSLMAVSTVIAMRKLYGDAVGFSLSQTASSLANLVPGSSQGSASGTPVDHLTYAMQIDTATAARFCAEAARGTRLRVTLIAADGSVLGDSRSEPSNLENHAVGPEFIRALGGHTSTDFRSSPTIGIDMAYAASPVRIDGRIVGALRVAMDAPDLAERLAPLVWMVSVIASLFIASLAAVSARIGATVMRPVEALLDAAARWSAGELDTRVPRFKDPDLAGLTETMNTMAAELSNRMKAMAQQQGELSAILDGMNEAVIATEADLSIRMVNKKARSLFGLRGDRRVHTADSDKSIGGSRSGSQHRKGITSGSDSLNLSGQSLLQGCGSSSLEALARRCIDTHSPQEAEICLYGDTTSTVLANAAPLAMQDGRTGAILVLNDITRIKRLERVRRDFVANVSHELRTPITLIKGFIETLEDGAIQNAEEAARFMGIIRRHADRMAAIVEDLLTLARMENPARGWLARRSCRVTEIIRKAIESLGDRPASKAVSILVDCPHDLEIVANEGLLEQALVNLLDNAVKYGPEGGSVQVGATPIAPEGWVSLSVRDEGQGIPAKDLHRLFERFYRVDHARSRDQGGTGLGLAIVRHIAMAHGGTATVQSVEGYGSTFCINLPPMPLSIHSDEDPSEKTETTSS